MYLLSIAGTIAVIDQFTKYLVRANLPLGQVLLPELWLTQYVRIVHWYNTGAAGGVFQGMNTAFTLLVFFIICMVLYFYGRTSRDEQLFRLAMALMLGGALGNLIDRLIQGHVTDFISIGNFPVLNIADACISCGATLLIFALWSHERKSKQPSESTPQSQETGTNPPGANSSSYFKETQGD
jgi:signal peptidase II